MFFDRTGGQPSARKARVSKDKSFRAPFKGWIQSEVPGYPVTGGAALLDNWFPTTTGVRMRKGSQTHATIAAAVDHIAVYDGASPKMFAADETTISDITSPADPEVAPTAAVSSLTSGDWSSVQIETAGGLFLVMVNGFDDMEQFDGTGWLAVNASSTPRSITGVDTADLSYVWKHKNRLFLIEKGTNSAWYLPSLAVGGAANELALGGVFTLGGSLLFGATFSQDAGDGLDDYCLFFTDKGEVAVYQGTDPSSASTWALVGVYRIGEPLHKNAHFRAGGDVAVLTREGIVPVSGAINKDRAALQMAAITYPIEEAWRTYMLTRTGLEANFCCVLWHTASMLVIGLPTASSLETKALAANARTGAWSSGFTGWDARCLAVFDNKLYFGTAAGTIKQGDTTGSDDGANFTAVCIPSFDMLKTPNVKSAIHCRATIRTNYDYPVQLFANSDYVIAEPTPLSAPTQGAENSWGTGVWGTSVWGSGEERKSVTSEWQNVEAVGFAIAPGISVTSGETIAPDVELTSLDLIYQEGEVIG